MIRTVFLFLALITITPADAGGVMKVTKEELKKQLGSADVTVIDVRSQMAYNASKIKIKGAVRENPAMFGQWAHKYPKDKTLVFYCT